MLCREYSAINASSFLIAWLDIFRTALECPKIEDSTCKGPGVTLNLLGRLKVTQLLYFSEVVFYTLIYIFILSSVGMPTSSILEVPTSQANSVLRR